MSRVDEVMNLVKQGNRNGGIPKDDWIIQLLTAIAVSLATIADTLNRKDGEADDAVGS